MVRNERHGLLEADSPVSLPDGLEGLDYMADPVLVIDPESYYVLYWNQAAEQAYGPPSPTAPTCYALSHGRSVPCDGPDHHCPLQECLSTGQSTPMEHLHYDRRGAPRYFRVQATAIREKTGRIGWVLETHVDISEQKAEQALLSQTFQMAEPTLITDTHGRIVRCNGTCQAFLGLSEAEVQSRTLTQLPLDLADGSHLRTLWRTLKREGQAQGEIQMDMAEGGSRTWWVSMTAVADEGGNHDGYVILANDLTAKRRYERRLQWQAQSDPLVGVYNRRAFENFLQAELERSSASQAPLALVMFDIDHFKAINDTYGHLLGDDILKEIAGIAASRVRKADVLARWGGEEFIVMLPDADTGGGYRFAEDLREQVAEADFPGPGRVTISLGVAERRAGDELKDFTRRVDEALYCAKGRGRNQVVVAR